MYWINHFWLSANKISPVLSAPSITFLLSFLLKILTESSFFLNIIDLLTYSPLFFADDCESSDFNESFMFNEPY